jgi:predicted N-acetyltransferase YhbS
MYCSTAHVATDRPDRYITQLVAHLGHKVPAERADDGRGTITFSAGQCILLPSSGHFDMLVTSEKDEGSASVRDVITRHLTRFATREELSVDWKPLVRLAVADDDVAILDLDRRSWTAGSGIPSAQARERTTFFDERRKPDSHLVAELGGELVGCVAIQPKSKFSEAAHVFGLWHLLVSPSARRLGIASALLAAAEQLAMERGARKMGLHVLGSNASAMRLYERHGYVVEGRYTNEFLIDGVYVDEVAMGKQLPE